MVGENLVVSGLGLPGSRNRVVTDAYHFDGSLYLYQQLAKQGLDLTILPPHNNQIDLNDLDKVIRPGTRMVAISLVQFHAFPFDPPGAGPFESEARPDTAGHIEVGTLGNVAVAALVPSLEYLVNTGVDRIQQYRQPMIDRLQTALPELGYAAMTPRHSTSPIVSFAYPDAARLKPRLDKANIMIQLYENRFRICPSFYNDMADIEKLIWALKPS